MYSNSVVYNNSENSEYDVGISTGEVPIGSTDVDQKSDHRVTSTLKYWISIVENTTNNVGVNRTLDIGLTDDLCSDWLEAQHAVFQLAYLCIFIAFLTPSTFRHHCFFLRIMLSIGYVLVVIWSSLFMCMPDVLSWNTIFFIVDITHVFYLGYRIVPERFTKTLDEVYNRSFKPLKVTRKQFKQLTEFGNMVLLPKGAVYAKHGHHKIGQKLSILLKGRLKVSYEDLYLHTIEANQFVDSPEYDCVGEQDNETTFQVTISASEDSLLFTWPYTRLRDHLSRDHTLDHVFDHVIGKDISQKLYEIQERQLITPGYTEYASDRRSSMVNVRHSLVSKSGTSLDNLNCLQGHTVHPDTKYTDWSSKRGFENQQRGNTQGCIVHSQQQPSNQSSLGTYETCL